MVRGIVRNTVRKGLLSLRGPCASLCMMAQEFTPARLKPKYHRIGRPITIRRVLLVDDESSILFVFRAHLSAVGPEIQMVDLGSGAKDLREQVLEFASLPRADETLIVMDGALDRIYDGEDLVRELRVGGYRGIIVANSGLAKMQLAMLRTGADFAAPGVEVIKGGATGNAKNAVRIKELFEGY